MGDNMWLIILLAISVVANFALVILLARAIKRVIQYDEVFMYLVDDIDTNLRQFAKMADTPLLTGDVQVQNAHRNMMIMGKRLEEIVLRVNDLSGVNLRIERTPPKPPVVE